MGAGGGLHATGKIVKMTEKIKLLQRQVFVHFPVKLRSIKLDNGHQIQHTNVVTVEHVFICTKSLEASSSEEAPLKKSIEEVVLVKKTLVFIKNCIIDTFCRTVMQKEFTCASGEQKSCESFWS